MEEDLSKHLVGISLGPPRRQRRQIERPDLSAHTHGCPGWPFANLHHLLSSTTCTPFTCNELLRRPRHPRRPQLHVQHLRSNGEQVLLGAETRECISKLYTHVVPAGGKPVGVLANVNSQLAVLNVILGEGCVCMCVCVCVCE